MPLVVITGVDFTCRSSGKAGCSVSRAVQVEYYQGNCEGGVNDFREVLVLLTNMHGVASSEDRNLQQHLCENLRPRVLGSVKFQVVTGMLLKI